MKKRLFSALICFHAFLLCTVSFAALNPEGTARRILSNNNWIKKMSAQYQEKSKRGPDKGQTQVSHKDDLRKLQKRISMLKAENDRLSAEPKKAEPKKMEKFPQAQELSPLLQGAYWLLMAPGEKKKYVRTAVDDLEKRGAYVAKISDFYMDAMDQYIATNPQALKQSLDFIFVSCVYEMEPENQQVIRGLFHHDYEEYS